MDLELKALYAMKGELTTQIEIANSKLKNVNEQIVQALNKKSPEVNGADKDKKEARA